jgi:hypothetical protein
MVSFFVYNEHMNKKLIRGDGFLASPNMVSFAQRMVQKEIEEAKRPSSQSFNYTYWNVSDRH